MPIPAPTEKAVERQSLRDIVTEKIRSAILDGTLQPGEHLNDQQLQNWLGVSRTPIREALNELARIGLVEMEPQRYTRVTAPDEEHALDYLQTLGALLGGVVRVTVPTLSAAATKEIAKKIDVALKAVEAQQSAEHSARAWDAFNLIVDECPNRVLVDATRDTIGSVTYRFSITRAAQETDWETLKGRYAALRQAILDGDAIEAELTIELIFRLPETSR